MKNAIYEGQVIHKRIGEKGYTFSYKLFMTFFNIAEIEKLLSGQWYSSYEKRNLVSYRREDYHGDPQKSLDTCVRDTVEEKLGKRPQGPIFILTHLRYFGLCFNPVSFYYCYDESGERLEFVMGEIENTPWGERYCYATEVEDPSRKWVHCAFKKEFHVSPFFGMDMNYAWKFSPPGDELAFHMDCTKNDGSPAFLAHLALQAKDFNSHNIRNILMKFPWITLKVVLGIYYQAFRIWLRGTPFFSHPNEGSQKSLLFLKGGKK